VTRTPKKKSAGTPTTTSSANGAPYFNVRFTDDAIDDLRGIRDRALPVLTEVFRALKRLDEGSLRPVPLNDYGKTGDLSDCGKIVVETDGYPEYRIVVRAIGTTFEISEVVTVEERANDLAYLLTGVRLGRIADPLRRSDTERRIARLRGLRDKEK
jgi:hypothetical protein